MPTLYMLIGVPASGKSSWIASQPFDWTKTVIASTDGHIERVAKQLGKTYDDVFRATIAQADVAMMDNVRDAVQHGLDIVWDQTNTGAHNRAKKLALLPASYKKVAVVFPTPEPVEHARRLDSRVGKRIPPWVMRNMLDNFDMPTAKEGFDEVKVL
jgi:predicted kinase